MIGVGVRRGGTLSGVKAGFGVVGRGVAGLGVVCGVAGAGVAVAVAVGAA